MRVWPTPYGMVQSDPARVAVLMRAAVSDPVENG
jgi:hypothetical protein